MKSRGISRRDFLRLAGVSSVLAVVPHGGAHVLGAPLRQREWITTGHTYPALAGFDNAMRSFMQARTISGGALAVTRNSKLLLARGYTYSDDSGDIVVQPVSRFRVASLSKPITATAVLRLVQDGHLSLSAKLTQLLTLNPPPGQSADPRLANVTVRNLLQHLGGWNRATTFDPMFRDRIIATALGKSLPISKADIATYMTGQPLQHTPGTTFAYSNYGYRLLGQIIEQVTGIPYQTYVNQAVFNRLNVIRTVLGRTLPAHRWSDEVKYHSQFTGITVHDNSGATVPRPYGSFNLENMDAHGGWLASAVDLARFAAAFDNPTATSILNPASVATMFALPENIDPGSYVPGSTYYACGWSVRDWGGGVRNTWHDGSLDGTFALLVRRSDGVNWCALFNQRDDPSGLPYSDIDGLLHTAANGVTSWPTHDLFPEYLSLTTTYLPFAMR